MDKLIRKTYEASETKALEDSRSLLVKISTNSPDRSKDIVVPQGATLDNYLKNPVVALAHKYDGLSIAKTEQIQINDEGILAKVTFPEKGVYPLADTVFELYKGGFMNAWSIGFIPLEQEDIEGGGRRFNKWELLEYSAVLVPDNPEALTLLRSKGIDTTELEKIVVSNKDQPIIKGKNRELLIQTLKLLEQSVQTLNALLAVKNTIDQDDANQLMVVSLVDALKMADQVVGKALRNYKTQKGELGIVPDDSLHSSNGTKKEKGGNIHE